MISDCYWHPWTKGLKKCTNGSVFQFIPEATTLNLKEVLVRPVCSSEEPRYQELMQAHHYLGALGKIGETLWYVATWNHQWIALVSFSAPAWKCSARDRWIGWSSRLQFARLKLITNNSRFLILPKWHVPNLASRILSMPKESTP
ncbi:MAG: DUF4338 domain-containing protein [Desulfovermiculus sp.]|nr:DUF4338 domain-containing protein [Desulfovermiculus sp.]